jgi:glycosyltransferase involved in cell wall biosynthesis
VIGSRTGGIPDIIEHGRTGLLFDPGDATALAQLMLETLTKKNDARERAQTAFKKVRQHHTVEAMGRNILRIYQLHHQLKLETQ